MEPAASESAIAAIDALQRRIRELEKEEKKLKSEKERYLQIINGNDDVYLLREEKIKEMIDKGDEMMNYSKKLTAEKENAKTENQILRKKLLNFEKAFPSLAKGSPKKKAKPIPDKIKFETQNMIKDYQILLKESIVPMELQVPKEELNFALVASSSPSIPDKINFLIEELSASPKNLQTLSFSKKMYIMELLLQARDKATQLSTRISVLKQTAVIKDKVHANDPQIAKYYKSYVLLTREINKFRF